MAELHRGGDAELREAREILRCEHLRVLDAVTQPERLPLGAGLLERVKRLAVGEIADRVDCDRKPCPGAAADDLRRAVPCS